MQKMACQTRRPSQNIHSALLCALLLISCCALFSLPAVQSSTSCSSVSSSGAAFADDASSCAQEKCTAPEIICCTCGTSSSTSAASSATSPSSASSASSSPSPASSGSSSASSAAPSSSSSSSSSSAASASSSPAPSSSASGSTTVPSGSSTSSGNSSGSTSESCLSTCYSQCYSSSSYATASPYSSAYTSSAAYNSSSSSSGGTAASPAESSSASATSSSAPAGTSSASSASPASSPAATSTAAASSQSSAAPGSTYPPEPCPCQLINALVQFKYQQLNSSEQQVFEDNCLVQLRAILVDVSLSVEQKIAQCGYVLRGFCAAHPDIGDKCKWVEVPGWGYVYDFAFMVAFAYEDELANSVCQLTDNSTGANNLTVEISNGTSAGQCGNSSVWSGFVSNANRINRRDIPTMSRARQLAWYSQVLELIYFQQYPDQEQCVRNISLAAGGYAGTVDEFLGLCDWYNTQSELLNSVLADSANATSAGDCPYVQSLQAGVSAANQSVNSNSSSSSSSASYNSSTVQEAQSFVDYCYSQFANVSDVSQRLQIVLAKFAQLSIQCRLLLKPIKIVGALVQCICADVIAIGNSCANGFACTNLTYGGPGESLEETCLVDGHNVSTLVEASQSYKNSLDSQHQLSYTSYHNAIRNCCYSSSYGTNLTARYECAQYYVTNWAGNQASVRAVYNQVQLTTTVVTKVNTTSNVLSAFFGTFGCFCQCATC